ncbi:MAG: indole-3-glycerol phosphate synthase TrpC [Planctomycetota bacterium]
MPDDTPTPDNPTPPEPAREPSSTPPPVLAEIVEHKRGEVEELKRRVSKAELEAAVAQAEPPRNFFRAVTRRDAEGKPVALHPAEGQQVEGNPHTAVIAEIKRQSPSAGLIREAYAGDGFDPARIARAYHAAGAAAISCLTDERYFGGHLSFIQRVKDACPLPVLRKDFIVDPVQLWEARAAGADAVLLIAECLNEREIVDYMILAQQLQLTVLIEAHSAEHLLRVRPHVGFPHPTYCLLGINNRDLTTMTTEVNHTVRLVDLVDDPGVLVSESGIKTRADLDRLSEHGVNIVLVGEHLMRQEDPGQALRTLLQGDAPTA